MGDILKLGEVAHWVGVSPSTVRNWVDRGFLPCHRTPAGHRLFYKRDVKKLLETMKTEDDVEIKN